jgi:hypothetical protein
VRGSTPHREAIGAVRALLDRRFPTIDNRDLKISNRPVPKAMARGQKRALQSSAP